MHDKHEVVQLMFLPPVQPYRQKFIASIIPS